MTKTDPHVPRALFVCHYLRHVLGGAEIIAHKVIGALRDAGWAVDVVALPGPLPVAADGAMDWTLPYGLAPESLRAKQWVIFGGGDRLDRHAVRQITPQLEGLAAGSYELVVAHDTLSAGVADRLAKLLVRPWVGFVYEPLPRVVPEEASWWVRPVLGWRIRKINRRLQDVYSGCRLVLAASEDTAKRFRAFCRGVRAEVVYNSAPARTMSATASDGWLYVGRLSREKGFDLLLEAYRRCSSKPRLGIAGLSGNLRAMAEALAAEMPQVTLLPQTPPSGMEAIYAQYAYVVAPSISPDPLPGAVLEARAYRKGILTTGAGGIPEIVRGYRRLRVVDSTRGRHQMIQDLARGIDEVEEWGSAPVDEAAEEQFMREFGADAHQRGVVDWLSSLKLLQSTPAGRRS